MKAAHSKYFAGFCFLSLRLIIAKKLDFAPYWEALNTSQSLFAFACFCSSSCRSRCKVRITFINSGCLSFNLQSSHRRKGFFCTLLCCAQMYDKSHVFSRTSHELSVNHPELFASLALLVL